MECVETFYEGMEARYDEMQEHPDFRMVRIMRKSV